MYYEYVIMMNKKLVTIIIILFAVIISGCTTKTANNGTFGEKKISIDNIKVSNNTTSYYSGSNDTNFFVEGYIINENVNDAFNVKIKIITFDAQNNIVGINDTPYMKLKNIPSNESSYFIARFFDPDKKIVRFQVEVIDAKSEFGI